MAAFTSTILTPLTTTERALKPVNEVMYESVKASKKKAYARISTSQGDINLVLHADMVFLFLISFSFFLFFFLFLSFFFSFRF